MLDNTLPLAPAPDTQTPEFFYQKLGQDSANSAQANLSSLPSSLNMAYGEFIKREANRNAERMQQYQAEKALLVEEYTDVIGNKNALAEKISDKQEDIEVEKKELARVLDEVPKPDYLPVVISGILLAGLTVFLFYLYSSNGYAALASEKTRVRPGLISSKVFSKARREDLLVLILSFPIVFMAIGYVAHLLSKSKQIIQLIFLVLFVLILDLLIAYKIAENLHKWDFAHGNTTESWVWTMALSVNVFIIIALGFIVYILWGYLLNRVLNEWESAKPKNIRKAEITLLKEKIDNLKKELNEFRDKFAHADGRLLQIKSGIEEIDKKINTLKGGGVIVDIPALQGMVGKFMEGWRTAITAMYAYKTGAEATQLIDQARDVSDQWLADKMKTFTS